MKIPETAERLAELGFCVLPNIERQKKAAGSWGQVVDQGPALCHATLRSTPGLTGATLSPAKSDPVPLLILDIDDHRGRPWETIWADLSPDPFPQGAGVVTTVNGGVHFYFRLPPGAEKGLEKKNGVDFGQGLRGDIFHSLRPKSLVVLPGSRVNRKLDGKVAAYKELRPLIPADFPEPPDGLMRRILNRKSAEPRHPDKLPTECIHFLRHLTEFGPLQVPQGGINTYIAEVGMILGRIAPQETPNDKICQAAHAALAPGLEGYDPVTKGVEFTQAFKSGWGTGQSNKSQYDKRDSNPNHSDVMAECRTLLGGEPWAVEFRQAGNQKLVSITLGIGGSYKNPDDAFAIGDAESLAADAVLPALERISGANPDAIASSPLMIQPNWLKVLRHHLMATKEIVYTGATPTELFVDGLRDQARQALEHDQLYFRLKDTRPDPLRPFIYYPEGQDHKAALIIPSHDDQEHLLSGCGDIGAAERIRKQRIHVKPLQGKGNIKRAWSIALKWLAEEANEDIIQLAGAVYEKKALALSRESG